MSLENDLNACLAESRRACRVPGLAAAVRLNGDLVWVNGAGFADIERSNSVSGLERFCLYSITKTLTAACVLALVGRGLIRLDAPAVLYRPELPLPGNITVTHLLQHTSGIGDYGALPTYTYDVRTRPTNPWSVDGFLAAVPLDASQFAPGQGWSYSNIGFMLLRLIVEAVTARSFRQCVEATIVDPLGLIDTFVAEHVADWQTCVPGYGPEVTPDGSRSDVRTAYHPGWCAPGVAVGTVSEATLIFDGFMAGRLFDKQLIKSLPPLVRVPGKHPPHVAPSAWLGLLADPQNPAGPLFFHGGAGPGYSVGAMILPRFHAGRLSLAVAGNASDGEDVELAGSALLDVATKGFKT